jgi:hypothetical protein
VSERHIGWPTYLALLIGITAAVDWIFDLLSLSEFTWGGVLFFAACMILLDFLTGDTPSQDRAEGEHHG